MSSLVGVVCPSREHPTLQLELFPLDHDTLLGACKFTEDQECCYLSTLNFYNHSTPFPMAGMSLG